MYRFGAFEVDPRAHELRRSGVRIKVQEQLFVLLLKLLERPGELVTREELRVAIWPADTFVDFDTGLNTIIMRLREVLRDSAEVPVFIETCGARVVAKTSAHFRWRKMDCGRRDLAASFCGRLFVLQATGLPRRRQHGSCAPDWYAG